MFGSYRDVLVGSSKSPDTFQLMLGYTRIAMREARIKLRLALTDPFAKPRYPKLSGFALSTLRARSMELSKAEEVLLTKAEAQLDWLSQLDSKTLGRIEVRDCYQDKEGNEVKLSALIDKVDAIITTNEFLPDSDSLMASRVWSSLKEGVGNCHEKSELLYSLLQEVNDNRVSHFMVELVQFNDLDHVFVRIEGDGVTIVADPWINAYAVMDDEKIISGSELGIALYQRTQEESTVTLMQTTVGSLSPDKLKARSVWRSEAFCSAKPQPLSDHRQIRRGTTAAALMTVMSCIKDEDDMATTNAP